MSHIAFIGLGNMGAGMAARQASAGRDVLAYDLSAEACARAAAAGCRIAASAVEAVTGASAVITMLPAGPHVSALYAEVIVPHAGQGTLCADCSTIDVDTARAVAERARHFGLVPADAPVSGGTTAAEAGTLAFMVGCDGDRFGAFEDLLAPMARKIVHTGGAGSGQAAKICNNMLLGISMIGVCEAFVLAEKLGLDGERFFEVAANSSGQCWSLTSYCPVPGPVPAAPSNREYQPGFAGAMMLKDLRLAAEAAASSGASTPMGARARDLYERFVEGGGDVLDFSGIISMLKAQSGASGS